MGAGDAFAGSFVVALERGHNLRHAVVQAVCASSLSTTVPTRTAILMLQKEVSGAQESLPTSEGLQQFLRERHVILGSPSPRHALVSEDDAADSKSMTWRTEDSKDWAGIQEHFLKVWGVWLKCSMPGEMHCSLLQERLLETTKPCPHRHHMKAPTRQTSRGRRHCTWPCYAVTSMACSILLRGRVASIFSLLAMRKSSF